MKKRITIISLGFVSAFLLAACNRGQNSPAASSSPASSAQPAAALAPASNPTASVASAPTSSAPATDPNAAVIEENQKLAGIDWAMKQDQIKHDPNGQWATAATASSSYDNAKGKQSWSAMQATGEPDVERYGDDGRAWAPKSQSAGIEWLDLKYAKPVNATGVRIRESCGSGTVARVELFDEMGNAHKIWQGVDPTQELNYLTIKFPATAYKTNRVRVTLATNILPGWKEIDAVQLLGK